MLSFCGYVLAVSFILFVLKYFFLFFNINILKKLKKLIFYKNTALPRRKDTGVNRNKSSTKKEIYFKQNFPTWDSGGVALLLKTEKEGWKKKKKRLCR
jgi:hypothetical protein